MMSAEVGQRQSEKAGEIERDSVYSLPIKIDRHNDCAAQSLLCVPNTQKFLPRPGTELDRGIGLTLAGKVTNKLDDLKKIFSEPKIVKILQVQFSPASRDESNALKKFENFEFFFVNTVFVLKIFLVLLNFAKYG